jgi:predicted aspartyl protease
VSVPFDPDGALTYIPVDLFGPTGVTTLRLGLDTGATTTVLNPGALTFVGYDLADALATAPVTTGSQLVFIPRMVVSRLAALGIERHNFVVLAHTLPPTTLVDGVLGLHFLRGHRLTIDFRAGELGLD